MVNVIYLSLNDGKVSRINDYLEEGLAEGKISKNLYNHLKGRRQIWTDDEILLQRA